MSSRNSSASKSPSRRKPAATSSSSARGGGKNKDKGASARRREIPRTAPAWRGAWRAGLVFGLLPWLAILVLGFCLWWFFRLEIKGGGGVKSGVLFSIVGASAIILACSAVFAGVAVICGIVAMCLGTLWRGTLVVVLAAPVLAVYFFGSLNFTAKPRTYGMACFPRGVPL